MDHDFDKNFLSAIEDGLKQAFAALTPEEQEAWMAQSDHALATVVEHTIRESASGLAETLKRDAPPMLAERREIRATMERRVAKHWGAGV